MEIIEPKPWLRTAVLVDSLFTAAGPASQWGPLDYARRRDEASDAYQSTLGFWRHRSRGRGDCYRHGCATGAGGDHERRNSHDGDDWINRSAQRLLSSPWQGVRHHMR